MKAMAKGAKYLIMKKKIFLSGDFNVPSLDISAKNSCLPNFQPKKMTISNPPRGNRTLDETKSIRSKTVMPPMAKGVFSIRLNEAKLPMTSVRTHVRMVAFFRLRCNSSERKATTTSSSEIVEVSAAIANNTKKMMQKIRFLTLRKKNNYQKLKRTKRKFLRKLILNC